MVFVLYFFFLFSVLYLKKNVSKYNYRLKGRRWKRSMGEVGGGGVPTGIAGLPLLSPLKTEIMHVLVFSWLVRSRGCPCCCSPAPRVRFVEFKKSF